MGLRDDILALLREHDIAPTRRTRSALVELLALVAAENPELPPPEDHREETDGDDDADGDDAGLAVRTITCPHCGEAVVAELELDGGAQEVIQDCSVCCRPISISWQVRAGQLAGLNVLPG